MQPDPPEISGVMARYALTSWFVGTLICFGLMLTHTSEPAVILGRYSPAYTALLASMLAATLVSGTLTGLAWINRLPDLRRYLPASPRLTRLLTVIGPPLLALGWALIPASRTQAAVALWLAYVGVVAGGVLVGLVAGLSRETDTLPRRTLPLIALGGAVVAVAAGLAWVGQVPASLHFDEPWITNWGVSMFSTGQPVTTMYPQHPSQRVAALSSITYPMLGGWLNLTGITFEAARLFYLLLMWAAAPFVALAARHLYGVTAGWATLALALLLTLPHNHTRPDAWVVPCLAIGLWLYVSARSTGQIWRAAGAGFALALTVGGHFLALRLPLAFGLILTAQYVASMIQKRRVYVDRVYWLFAVGGLAGGLALLVFFTLPWGLTPADFLAELSGNYDVESGFDPSGTPFSLLARWLTEYIVRHTVELALLVVGLLAAIRRGSDGDRTLLALLALATVGYAVLTPKHNFYYYVHHLPLVALWGGALVADLRPRLAAAAALLVIGGLLLAHTALLARPSQSADTLIANGHAIDALLPDDVRSVAGSQAYYYGLSARDFVGIELFVAAPPDDWPALYGVAPPGALVLTQGLDTALPNVRPYIESAGMTLSYCLPLDVFGGQTRVYLLPEYANDAPGC